MSVTATDTALNPGNDRQDNPSGVRMAQPAFQDLYPDELSHCYGCGRLNEHGLQIKSYGDGDETVTTFLPRSYHIAIPGYVCGELIASLLNCHATGTAAAYRAAGRKMGSAPAARHFNHLYPGVVL